MKVERINESTEVNITRTDVLEFPNGGDNIVLNVEYKDGKAYLKMGSGNYTLQIKKKEATGIQEVNISRARLNDVYYDLEGRNHGKVRPSQKGIFIWNQKKVVL